MREQIIARGRDTWRVRYFVGRDPETGKRKYEGQTVHGPKKEAEKRLREALSKLDKGEHAAGTGRVLIGSLLDDLLADYRINGQDEEGIEKRRCEVHVRPYFGRMPVAKLGTAEIRRYIEKRRTGEKRPIRPGANARMGRQRTPPSIANSRSCEIGRAHV